MRSLLADRAGTAVLTAALVVQAVGLIQFWDGSPFARHLILDAYRYDVLARTILTVGFPLQGVHHQAPLYPHFVALVYAATGSSLAAVYVVQAFLGALSAFLLYRLGTRHMGRPSGVAAGFLGVFSQGLIAFAPRLLPVVGIVFLELLFLDRIPDAGERAPKRWIAPGIIAGLLVIASPGHLLLVPLAMFGAIIARRGALRSIGVLALAGAAVVAPVTLHNVRSGGGLVLVSSNGGETFYHGNNPRAAGTYALMAGLESADVLHQERVAREIAEQRTGRELNAAAISRFWFGEGLRFIREDPARFAWLELQKLRYALGGEEVPDIYSPSLEGSAFTPLYRIGVARLPLVLPLVLAGLVLLGRRTPPWLAGLMLVNVITLLAFYVSNRYRVPLEVLCLLPAGHALARIAERRTQRWLFPGLAILLTLLATSDPVRSLEARGKVLVNLGASLGRSGELEEAERAFRSAIAADPGWARSHHYLGRALANQGRDEEAVAAYEHAAALAPAASEIRIDLAAALLRTGRGEKAAATLAAADTLAASNGDVPALARIAQTWLTLERPDRAARTFGVIARSRVNDAQAWTRFGIATGLAGDPGGAHRALERALELDAEQPAAWEALARALGELGECDAARRALADAPARSGMPASAFEGVARELDRLCPQH